MKCKITPEAEQSCEALVNEYVKYGYPWEKLVITAKHLIPDDPEETFIISVSRVHRIAEKNK
jgi:hypothetical protein